ncbi:hypothetical protein ACT7CS_27775 [Bacillus pacificus]
MYRNLLNFSLYCILSLFIYLTTYFISIKPAIINATSINYNRMQFVWLLLLLILISMIYGLIIRKLIRHNSRYSHSIKNENILFIFSHIFTALILFLLCLFRLLNE